MQAPRAVAYAQLAPSGRQRSQSRPLRGIALDLAAVLRCVVASESGAKVALPQELAAQALADV